MHCSYTQTIMIARIGIELCTKPDISVIINKEKKIGYQQPNVVNTLYLATNILMKITIFFLGSELTKHQECQ